MERRPGVRRPPGTQRSLPLAMPLDSFMHTFIIHAQDCVCELASCLVGVAAIGTVSRIPAADGRPRLSKRRVRRDAIAAGGGSSSWRRARYVHPTGRVALPLRSALAALRLCAAARHARSLFAPLTGLEVRSSRVEGSVLIVEVNLNVNLQALTIEAVVSKRRQMLGDMCVAPPSPRAHTPKRERERERERERITVGTFLSVAPIALSIAPRS